MTLSPREEQVAVRVAAGWSNEAIGTDLFLDVNTVKAHLKRVMKRTGALNRAQLTTWVWATGLVGKST